MGAVKACQAGIGARASDRTPYDSIRNFVFDSVKGMIFCVATLGCRAVIVVVCGNELYKKLGCTVLFL